ncbi:MAG: acetyl-CoA carboxylase biotin carboxylase subunit [Candidatus Eisenbacteria bacterium]|nr:acetyl-CoA carboxylase biotin carboxylase subunit [Candidatus Eisenbacteria bacterium]
MMKKILIANRGEIAVRVVRACRDMGIPCAVVYSDADRASLHVLEADEAVRVGPAPALESYLNIDAVIDAAKTIGADAIHPGYGFLAENWRFAKRCEDEGLTFIGPTSRALELVADKIRSRETMLSQKVPIIPGMLSSGADLDEYRAKAREMGYPVLVKASAGGGGKGMQVVREEGALAGAIEASSRVAASAFGDDTVYIEKLIERPRHVEFQVLADIHGNCVHLFERECSIQRRHQKIVEESPSPALNPELRARMGATAVRAAKACGYTNAGTVEFLLDEDGSFYFLEVNARIQVEHPVTEMVTGVDLVRQQILIASGERLEFAQEDLAQKGHAIECRIYAEDPGNNFLPSSGKITLFREPQGPGVRHDCGIYEGWEVPVHYDPILSKLIVHAEDRDAARSRMKRALSDMSILGIATCLEYLWAIIDNEAYAAGETQTDFIERHMSDWKSAAATEETEHLALIAAALSIATDRGAAGAVSERAPSPWDTLGAWRIGGAR